MSVSESTVRLVFDRLAYREASPSLTLTLTFEQRQKARLRARTDDDREVALILERGQVLRGGSRLLGPANEVLEVVAAAEALSEVRSASPIALTRAAYHLGNRHVALQVGDGWLRYLKDHVLDDMIVGLGLAVTHISAGFEPESGAYAGAHHHHGHARD